MRKITSMTMLVTLVVLILNSIVLYVVPEGRIAYWADWRFLGLTKTEWGDQHITIGFLFLLASFLHLYYNWGVVKSYLKNKVKEIKVFTLPCNIALAVTSLIIVLTYFQVPPVSYILDLSAYFKRSAAETYGEPPYGHAEKSSLQMLTRREGIELDQALALLDEHGVRGATGSATVLAIARDNRMTPQAIYNIILPAKVQLSVNDTAAAPPIEPPPSGLGRKTLEQLCSEMQLDCPAIIAALSARGISSAPGNTIRQIAEANNKRPTEIYELIWAFAQGE
ncbi:DUF4405 domain-containing protein [Desulfobulbus alkaliphilus]|uniref:DUF4405 domain-containing protein n=1 Tax=Desulfobulbus alkaliphilus TaxID=869814 RepID=UPI001963205A|nr:DUF4405 domain-containing protein [Desulfobulbus alkaliphilus]MBM9537915.1 DUF4405 domain-containing protein [Desulfobulbus alkaliphilus]